MEWFSFQFLLLGLVLTNKIFCTGNTKAAVGNTKVSGGNTKAAVGNTKAAGGNTKAAKNNTKFVDKNINVAEGNTNFYKTWYFYGALICIAITICIAIYSYFSDDNQEE